MACTCIGGVGNLGIPGCMDEVMTNIVGFVLVPLTDNDGNKNGITKATDTLNESFFVDKFNQSDVSKRWFPATGLKEVAPVTSDSSFKDYNDGSQAFLNKGIITFNAIYSQVSWAWAGGFESARCIDHGYYLITDTNQYVGYDSADGTQLLPIPADKQSVDTKAVFPVAGGNPQELEIRFNFRRTVKIERFATVLDTDIVDYDLTEAKGLLNVTATISDIVSLGYTATLTLTDFGSYKKAIPVTGWLTADFELYNNTDDVSIPLVSTEGVDGVYAHVIADQAGDTVTLDSAVTTGVFVKKRYQLPDTEFVAG